MPNLNLNVNRTPLNTIFTADVPVDTSQRHQILKQYLAARETVRFFEEYVKSQQQEHLDNFVLNTIVPRMYSTNCEEAPSAAAEIINVCTAFHAEAGALKTTAVTLGTALTRLDEHIAAHVGQCGSGAACVLEDHIALVEADLSNNQSRREGKTAWVRTLRTFLAAAERDHDDDRVNGRSGFGTRFPSPHATQTNAQTDAAGNAMLVDDYRTEVRITAPVAETFNARSTSRKPSRKS